MSDNTYLKIAPDETVKKIFKSGKNQLLQILLHQHSQGKLTKGQKKLLLMEKRQPSRKYDKGYQVSTKSK